MKATQWIILAALFMVPMLTAVAAEAKSTVKAVVKVEAVPKVDAETQKELFTRFEKAMSGVKMVGNFTVIGKDTPADKEEYTILEVKKLEQGDLWLFRARVKYGKTDLTLPMPIPVKWVGNVPVISMANLAIPGLGTFSAHVVIDGNKYAGTWSHGAVGGHMFGLIEKVEPK